VGELNDVLGLGTLAQPADFVTLTVVDTYAGTTTAENLRVQP
jgi:hypothetical protein